MARSAALGEPGQNEGGHSRLAVIVAGAVAAVAATPFLRLLHVGSADAASKAEDERILQLVLQLEYTQVAFYQQALRHASLAGELRRFAQIALGHEQKHLGAIQTALGAKAGPKPTFDFGANTKSPDAFRMSAIKLEDIAVAGYNGQATNLTKGTLAAAAEIVSVEARHAAWVRAIAGQVAAPHPVDRPMTAAEVATGLHELGLRTA
jgi:rubrerythrin